jgi:hypothetical protein
VAARVVLLAPHSSPLLNSDSAKLTSAPAPLLLSALLGASSHQSSTDEECTSASIQSTSAASTRLPNLSRLLLLVQQSRSFFHISTVFGIRSLFAMIFKALKVKRVKGVPTVASTSQVLFAASSLLASWAHTTVVHGCELSANVNSHHGTTVTKRGGGQWGTASPCTRKCPWRHRCAFHSVTLEHPARDSGCLARGRAAERGQCAPV